MTAARDAALPRLADAILPSLAGVAAVPAYDRAATRIGVVHFGPGAFHRAHQAVYLDALLATDPDWAISAVSLHSSGVRDALRPQDGLYTLVLLGTPDTGEAGSGVAGAGADAGAGAPPLRVIGSIRELLCARDEGEAVLARLADPQVRLVTLTITEKGYCLSADGVDLAHPDIAQDLAAAETPDDAIASASAGAPGSAAPAGAPASAPVSAPVSAIGWLVAGLRLRHARGLAPFTVLSCDNLADNGGRLRRALLQFVRQSDPALAAWIEAEVSFPRSMVDSITPASDDALRGQVAARLGVADAWPVQREPYTQWVVEDDFRHGRPPLERVGVVMSGDIAGYDRAKLRLLNAPHSALAYLGSLLEIDTVAAAMREPALAGFVRTLMREDIVPSLPALAGFDPQAYVEAILQRFRNPAIRHLLAQIAWDGSQKLPVRLLGTIADALAAGRPIHRLCLPVAGWMQFVRWQARHGVAIVDPLADALAATGLACNGDADHDVALFLALDAVLAPFSAEPRFAAALCDAYAALGDGSPTAVAAALAAAR
jgi:fructuronate reductase